MKKALIKISSILLPTLIIFLSLKKNNLKAYDYITPSALNLFFTVITVLFPIGMSIATGIDLSKVANKTRRSYFVSGLKQTVKAFCIYFIIDCIAMLGILIIQQVKHDAIFIHFLYVLSLVIILFSVFYFLYNFVKIFNFKRELEDRIFDELQEDK
nr:MAG TPA: hypothetical protein [Caudoviricetes sp.]